MIILYHCDYFSLLERHNGIIKVIEREKIIWSSDGTRDLQDL